MKIFQELNIPSPFPLPMWEGARGRGGFTLIEVVVAMSIFSLIAVGTSTAVSRGLAVKKRVETEWNEVHGIRTALFRLERDISLAFHIKRSLPSGFSGDNKWFKTYFIGKSDSLQFTSLSHKKLYRGVHESEMTEIGYRLLPQEGDISQYRLLRREDPIIDEDPEKGGEEIPLLENIYALSFKFYSKKQDRWLEDWDTARRDFEDQFPEAVAIKFSFKKGEKEEEYSAKIMVAHPNNETLPGGGTP